jgi:7-cyano-7-deazaguanine reductase
MIKIKTLGIKIAYEDQYNKNLLDPIARQLNRDNINISSNNLPFHGFDILNIYEISWLDKNNKPNVALGELIIPANSPNIIESKSLKLYFNSFNNSVIASENELLNIIRTDLSEATQSTIDFQLISINSDVNFAKPAGICLDQYNCNASFDKVNPELITINNDNIIAENLYSNLLKSNCLVTSQPDWGTIEIAYKGNQIDHVGLLEYILSFRNHQEFHEHCVERIFTDIMKRANPTELTVIARYTRRGGIDICPMRSTNSNVKLTNKRYIRQ